MDFKQICRLKSFLESRWSPDGFVESNRNLWGRVKYRHSLLFVRGVVGACCCLRWWALIAVCERGHLLPFVKGGACRCL